jgi:phage tail sheath protein FI
MPVALSYPGVYTVEAPSGVRTIVGVPTAVALFVGSSADGPVGEPVLCLNYSDFVRAFSDDVTADHHLPRAVRLFFLNGGQQCWVVRVAHGAAQSQVTLKTEGAAPQDTLKLTAKNAGLRGNFLRVAVDYDTAQPEATFNLEVFRLGFDAGGNPVKQDAELWRNLTMDPSSPSYAPNVLAQSSKLVGPPPGPPPPLPSANNGVSIGMRPVQFDTKAAAKNNWDVAWDNLVNKTAPLAQQFKLSLGGRPPVTVDLSGVTFKGSDAATAGPAIRDAIVNAYKTAGVIIQPTDVAVDFIDVPLAGTAHLSLLRITGTKQDVFVQPGQSKDAAGPLMLGTAQGGLEVSSFAAYRPAPTANTFQPSSDPADPTKAGDNILALYKSPSSDLASITIPGAGGDTINPLKTTLTATDLMFPTATSGGVRQRFQEAAAQINSHPSTPTAPFFWQAGLWGSRLALRRSGGDENALAGVTTGPGASLPFGSNVRWYSLGTSGAGAFQTPGVAGDDGKAPTQADYDAAFKRVDQAVDIFNLLVLPPDTSSADMTTFWGPASVFCDQRRAFLIMDAPTTWKDVAGALAGVGALRIGLVKDHAGIFFPRVTIDEQGSKTQVGPAGAIAGLMARIDGARGVWKAPAGTEADLRGVVGIEQRFSDPENGVLNPKAINTVRVFPNGIVNWGARTMDGDDQFQSEYKYIPIRRTALFIEGSLYLGLKWVVFEPNDEPLWAQIRLNVGAFMNGLFRQGAFQGVKPSDAYFVRCDAETTTQDDRNRGIVNIWVGFAPLKPAEFVVLYLQQMAGQIQV